MTTVALDVHGPAGEEGGHLRTGPVGEEGEDPVESLPGQGAGGTISRTELQGRAGEGEQDPADHDGGVGHVEHRPPLEIDEINDVARR